MKKIGYFLLILCLMSCESEILEKTTDEQQFETKATKTEEGEKIVVRFKAGLSVSEKAEIRASYGVIAYEKCSCGDENLESWDVEEIYEGATIEERVSSMEQDPEMEGADFEFDISISSPVPSGAVSSQVHMQSIFSKIQKVKKAVTIGVLDTGINPSYFGFEQPFLYNSTQDITTCGDEFFGWNFVENNNLPIDDNGHGTIVSYLIYEQLENTGTNLEILPAKAFDSEGKSSLFRVACGLSYLIKKEVHIINMSFGWETTFSTIIHDYIKEVESSILMVTSAGNTGQNNDDVLHFPSSYTPRNILAVTAVDNATPPNIYPSLSNVGPISVDIAVYGIGIPFYPTFGVEPISISGSSYSSAKAAGFSATKYQEGMSMSVFYHKILQDKILSSTLSGIKYASYLDL